MVALNERTLNWQRQSDGFYRTPCGRFDLMYSPAGDYWAAFDWEAGLSYRHPERSFCLAWCSSQLTARASS